MICGAGKTQNGAWRLLECMVRGGDMGRKVYNGKGWRKADDKIDLV